jgi:HD-like signal output (HDOD) protein
MSKMSDAGSDQKSIKNNQSLHLRILADVARDLSGEVNFPTTLDLAIKMRNTFRNPGLTPDDFVDMVDMEPLIASKLLRLANAPSCNSGGDAVSDLHVAVTRLGMDKARSAALAVAMDQIMKSKNLAPFDHFAQLTWEHSIKSAAIARVLARHVGRIDPAEAMLAGLVHDIGVYYLFYRASEYSEYREDPSALIELVLGWHESIGESVLHTLCLPEKIVEAVRDHDCPRLTDHEPRNLSDIVYIANLLAGSNWEWLPNLVSDEEARAMEKTRQHFAHLLPEAEQEIRELHLSLS